MKRLVLLFLFLIPVSAGSATYSWTDRTGTVHFTDDPGSVPKQYRKKALQQAGGDDTAPPVTPAAAPAPTAAKEVMPAASTAATAGTPVTPSTRFGDRTAAEWQAQFRALQAELADIQKKQEALKQEAGDGKKFLTRSQIDDINARNKQLHNDYEATRLRFNSLVEQANKVGLPPEFAR